MIQNPKHFGFGGGVRILGDFGAKNSLFSAGGHHLVGGCVIQPQVTHQLFPIPKFLVTPCASGQLRDLCFSLARNVTDDLHGRVVLAKKNFPVSSQDFFPGVPGSWLYSKDILQHRPIATVQLVPLENPMSLGK